MMTLSQLLPQLSGNGLSARIQGPAQVEFRNVSIDTRTLEPGALYVALRGPRFDGHEFAPAARERGAVALLVERPVPVDLPQLIVTDARRALGHIAAHWRARFSLPVIAVTGSNGKTTTTQMIAAIFAQAYGEREGRPCWFATRGNRNNEIGVPLMLLELRHEHRAAVLELGMNHPGEIRILSEWAQPSVALVTNAQREHQEFLDSVEATAHENGLAITALPATGTAVFPADDACAPIWRKLAGTRRTFDFALHGAAAVRADYRLGVHACQLDIRTPGGSISTELALGGEHNVRNALAASAGCLAIGIGTGAIAAGLARFRPVGGRGTRRPARGGACLIDESYNANPDSVRAAIDLLAQHQGHRVLVFGDMGEVGSRAEEFHREIGVYARERGIDRLLALGPQSQFAVAAFGAGASHFDTVEELIAAASAIAQGAATAAGAAGDDTSTALTFLVKGSRFMRMERVIAALEQDGRSNAMQSPGAPQNHA
ncbi:UDP-N-acetylmuramoyl-tripeptide--D-alanyl-D-alanine ligase [Burkholderiales bacterium]|jgi:UDP-N-acetylmuramoyl-tripeptide--D-alanyl-D-alanine ligase|nr:UDP-N-acetylmuramoyl-tripeptide--D-alanyl-D-alanine ligase [Burkholderiales bacterium]